MADKIVPAWFKTTTKDSTKDEGPKQVDMSAEAMNLAHKREGVDAQGRAVKFRD